jgi:hypothetical protein
LCFGMFFHNPLAVFSPAKPSLKSRAALAQHSEQSGVERRGDSAP